MPEDSELAFFPANDSQFVERAGAVARLEPGDFDDEHKRRHLESFRESMEAWRGYERKLGQQKEDAALLALVDDLLQVQHLIQSAADLEKQLKPLRRKHKIGPGKQELAAALKARAGDGASAVLESILIKRQVRTASGVAVVTVLTSPGKFSCPKDCHYCPNEPGQPRSYLSTEPAVLRGNQNGWDPARQFWDRARTLTKNGHTVDKVELLVLGGTWSGYAHEYQEEFVRDLFYAANVYYEWLQACGDAETRETTGDAETTGGDAETPAGGAETPSPAVAAALGLRPRLSLLEEQTLNEVAKCKVIGLTLETRPDYVSKYELVRLRAYGCTRVQLGLQHTDDAILAHINRGCSTGDAARAIRLLKDSCFKVDIHLMPDLPGSDPVADTAMFDQVLRDPRLQADQWKIYPCEVTPFSRIAEWYRDGQYKPYTETLGEAELLTLILKVKRLMHPWIRLNRVVRDIPNPSIIAGNSKTNLRQLLDFAAAKLGWRCACMRCREIRTSFFDRAEGVLKIRSYRTFGGDEYFLSFETRDEKTLFGFLRLRLPDRTDDDKQFQSPFQSLKTGRCALIRELHVYGMLVATTEQKGDQDTRYQHSGFGKQLVYAAEALSVSKGFDKVAIIAGVGTREYYRKLGYRLEETYMLKDLSSESAQLRVFEQWRDAPLLPDRLCISHTDWDSYPRLDEVKIDAEIVRSVLDPAKLQKSEKRKLRKEKEEKEEQNPEARAIDTRVTQAQWTEYLTRPGVTTVSPTQAAAVSPTQVPENETWPSRRTLQIAAVVGALALLGGLWWRKTRRRC
eukprot:Gregarina_sp_Pseudo_9__5396@NODE_65_length_4632_cov_53_918354_g60_i0_p1_GENE_NODE_65_length_4632_cov_53_918354_g60_i0NODE_65_length_4632_cov_53_918354_g60_i0_p1_ORF_typecomplete_len796_score302_05Radical_SAM/PF04055_21/3_2e22Radical_SAM/PF04055_21/8_9e03Radical_SAM_C/PF16199_5/4_3e22Acetyltransf_1/PF00583_25/1_3e04Acetyltransf_1/PF00583_25/5_2e08Acetyltransf_10/PF13673_7/9_9e03Acetyltransf_10/PF13673_7/0_00023RXLR/PF16810_5/0_3Acetyltransf_7/PF13508_7/0_37Alpha_GJ/PF03229_13/3_5e03Alpha_GJ/PF032